MPLFYILVYWPQGMWDLNSQPRGRTHAPYPGRQSLNHWMPGKSQERSFPREWRVPPRVCLRSQPREEKGASRAGVKWAHRPSGRVSESQGARRGVTEDSMYLREKNRMFFQVVCTSSKELLLTMIFRVLHVLSVGGWLVMSFSQTVSLWSSPVIIPCIRMTYKWVRWLPPDHRC